MAAVLHLVRAEAEPGASARRQTASGFVGVPLPVVFADPADCEALRAGERQAFVPSTPPQMAADDRYLVVPDDIGIELLDIVREGDEDLWHEVLRDSVLLEGPCERWSGGQLALLVEQVVGLGEWFARTGPYACQLGVGPGLPDPLERLRREPALRCNVVGGLLDEEGLDRVLASAEFLGVGWRPPARYRLEGVQPTLLWSRRTPDGAAAVELALFEEFEDLSVLLRPVRFELAAD